MWLQQGQIVVMAIACACAVANLLAEIVDHYDRRNNEHRYADFRQYTFWAGWLFFIVALLARSPPTY